MAKAQVWDEDTYTLVDSARDYDPFKVAMIEEHERGYGYGGDEAVTKRLYFDPETGIVVHDVKQYEQWLERNRLT